MTPPRPPIGPRGRARGVTLLELLVALSIFAAIGVAAYTALFAVLDARSASARQSERLAAVQYAVGTLADDLRQAIDRPVYAAQPSARGAVVSQPGTSIRLRVTRGGWPNPAGLPRSTLTRVEWLVEDERLVRRWHARPDALAGTEPTRRVLLREVDALELRFLGERGGRWQDRWPPLNAGPELPPLPAGVEVTLELADWGEIVRVFALAAGTPEVEPADADAGESDGQSDEQPDSPGGGSDA